MWQSSAYGINISGANTFGVAPKSEIAHTVSIETIEYKRMKT